MTEHSPCSFIFSSGTRCPEASAGKGLCAWHDPTIPKTQPNLVPELEQKARSGDELEGLSLIRADLQSIDLVRHGSADGYNLAHSDLFRANLKGAHLFHVNFAGASLMKANLTDANLHNANLEGANLLGAKLDGAKIENVIWGEEILQETKGKEAFRGNQVQKAHDFFQQAEEIYRNLRKVSELGGLFENAGVFFIKEMRMRRMQKPFFSLERIVSMSVDIFCGYGERPLRVIGFSLLVILFCACAFFILGISDSGTVIRFNAQAMLSTNLRAFADCLYFSVITFTTLGYGDLVPIGFARMVSAIEAFSGSFTLALFVVVFIKKMTR